MANSKDTLTANTFTPLPSPLPQGARGLNSERREQDVPTLPINMGFGISFLGLLRRHSPRPLAGEGLGERGNVAQNDARFPRIEYGAGSNVEHGMTELEHGMTQEAVGWSFNPTLTTHAQTLSGTGTYKSSGTSPSDAFVALLNANTGASLAAPIGLTRTDALLNIQANGAELKATGVTSVINPDGSRTYVVDSM